MSSPTILIDAMNLIFRVHYTHRNLSCDGKPTGVLFGFLKTIADLQQNVSRNIIVAWDHGIPVLGAKKPRNWREDFMMGYKANRSHDNEDWPLIVSQLQPLYNVIRLLGYSNVASIGLEADDVIGILAKEIEGEILIFSNDKDFYQLLCDRIKVLVPKKEGGKFLTITQAGVEEEFGIKIWHWDRYLALGGDSSDNIKPMRGMGPATAIKLVKAGASPHLDWGDQPEEFRNQKQFEKYKPAWEAVKKSYIAARLSRSRQDFRFAGNTFDFSSFDAPVSQTWGSDFEKKHAQEEFVKFCAEREMTSILSLRRQLFNSSEPIGEQPLCPPKIEKPKQNTLPPIPLARPKLQLRKTLI